MSPKLYILVGVAGTGKSTFAEQLEGVDIHATDDIREELTGDYANQSKNDAVFNMWYARINRSLSEGQSTVADSTALSAKTRAKLNEIARLSGASVVTVVFHDVAGAFERNPYREKPLPYRAMLQQTRLFEQLRLGLEGAE